MVVALAGPPPVSTQTMSNSWSEPIIDRKHQVRMLGPISGMTTRHWVCHHEAPSSWAAS